jgi:hypothetical protein
VIFNLEKDDVCYSCKAVYIANWGHDQGPPICKRCAAIEAAQYELTRAERLVVRLLKSLAAHKSRVTSGPDPYAGDRWEIKVGKFRLVFDDTIVICGRLEWWPDQYHGKLLFERRAYDYGDVRMDWFLRVLSWVADALQKEYGLTRGEGK